MNRHLAYRSAFRPLNALRRAGLLVCAVAFLAQMMVWAVYAPAMAAGQVTVICTADGLATVAVDADGRQQTPEKVKVDKTDCTFSVLARGLSNPPPPVDAPLPAQQVARHQAQRLPGAVIAAGWFLSTLQARAPPADGFLFG